MEEKYFNKMLEEHIQRTRAVLGVKAGHYASETDRLANFKRAAAMLHTTPEQACVGFMMKHWVSVMDMVDGTVKGKTYPIEMWHEKLGDSINYLILLEALITERMEAGAEYFDRHAQNEPHHDILLNVHVSANGQVVVLPGSPEHRALQAAHKTNHLIIINGTMHSVKRLRVEGVGAIAEVEEVRK